MTIEPEALYSLFDTLFLPVEKPVSKDPKVEKTKPNGKLLMLFDKKYTDEEKEFLNKILAAINIKPEEVEINFEVSSDTLPEIIERGSGNILIWGIDYSGTEKYKATKTGEKLLILSDALSAVKNDQSLKAKLWNCLKEVFVN